MKDYFAVRADGYDHTDYRLNYVDEMARAIRRVAPIESGMRLLDFGAGTGLLTQRLAPFVEEIIAVDISPSMIVKLEEKKSALPCRIETLRRDLTRGDLPNLKVDGIVSTMTFHHIEDPLSLLKRLKQLLKPGGFVAFCDVDTEDGSFHTVDTGVKHFGFERESVLRWMEEAGYRALKIEDATIIEKPHGAYPAFVAYGEAEQ
ncbi:class I SAM-dependent DNA methyltransferase [Nitratifractor sp.]